MTGFYFLQRFLRSCDATDRHWLCLKWIPPPITRYAAKPRKPWTPLGQLWPWRQQRGLFGGMVQRLHLWMGRCFGFGEIRSCWWCKYSEDIGVKGLLDIIIYFKTNDWIASWCVKSILLLKNKTVNRVILSTVLEK